MDRVAAKLYVHLVPAIAGDDGRPTEQDSDRIVSTARPDQRTGANCLDEIVSGTGSESDLAMSNLDLVVAATEEDARRRIAGRNRIAAAAAAQRELIGERPERIVSVERPLPGAEANRNRIVRIWSVGNNVHRRHRSTRVDSPRLPGTIRAREARRNRRTRTSAWREEQERRHPRDHCASAWHRHGQSR